MEGKNGKIRLHNAKLGKSPAFKKQGSVYGLYLHIRSGFSALLCL